ncbi:MAG: hypothetical protein HY335_11255 [Deinococcus sp.]|nr:hypothetical protein [Deinococcus sp.]
MPSRRLCSAALVALGIGVAGCPAASLSGFLVNVPATVSAAGNEAAVEAGYASFAMTVTALSSAGGTLTSFNGSVTVASSVGTIHPTTLAISQGVGTGFFWISGVTTLPARELAHRSPVSIIVTGGGEIGAGTTSITTVTSYFIDPSGDTFAAPPPPPTVYDLTSLKAIRGTSSLVLELTFTTTVVPPSYPFSGPNELRGFIELDTDQNLATGAAPQTDIFCPAASGLRVEFILQCTYSPVSPDWQLTSTSLGLLGAVTATYAGSKVTLTIPLSGPAGIADDGILNLAGVLGNKSQPTDCVPSPGHYSVARGQGSWELLAVPTTTRWMVAQGQMSATGDRDQLRAAGTITGRHTKHGEP